MKVGCKKKKKKLKDGFEVMGVKYDTHTQNVLHGIYYICQLKKIQGSTVIYTNVTISKY